MVKNMNVKYAYLIQEAVYRHAATNSSSDTLVTSVIPEQLKIFECLSNNDYKKAVQLTWYHNYSHIVDDVDSIFEEYIGSDVMKPKLAKIFKKFVKDPNSGCLLAPEWLEEGCPKIHNP